MQFLQNQIAIYGASLEAQKVMLPPLKCQIFCFWSKILLLVLFTQWPRQQIQFLKIWLCHLLVYMAKYPHAKNWETHRVDPEKNVIDRQASRQTSRQTDKDGLMNSTDFIEPLLQRWRFHHVFQKFENKTLNYLAWLWALLKESIQKKNKKQS